MVISCKVICFHETKMSNILLRVAPTGLSGCEEAKPCLAVCGHDSSGSLLQQGFKWRVLVGRPKVYPGLERRNWRLQDGGVGKCKLFKEFYSVKVSHLPLNTHGRDVKDAEKSKLRYVDLILLRLCGRVLCDSAGTTEVLWLPSVKRWIMGVSRCCGCTERTTRSPRREPWTSSCTGSMRTEVRVTFMTNSLCRSQSSCCAAEEKKDTGAETSVILWCALNTNTSLTPTGRAVPLKNKSTCAIFFVYSFLFFFRWGTCNSPPGRHHPARCNPTEHPGNYQEMGEEDRAMTGQHARMFGITFPLLLSCCVPRESWRCQSATWPWASCAPLWSSRGSKPCSAAALPAWSAPSQTLFTRER